jgi:hypothetical protein
MLAVLAAGPAEAQTTSALSWSRLPGAESCVGAAELARRVEERLGRAALVAPSQADRSVEGRVSRRRGGGWQAALVLADASGAIQSERALETRERDCRALDEALVLVIALLIDPDGAPPPPPPEPEPRVVIREVVREVRVRQPWRLAGRSGIEVEQGALPDLAWAVLIAAAIDPPGLPLAEIAGFATLAEEAGAALPERSAEMRMAGAALAMCPAVTRWLRACGVGRLAWFRWRGDGFEIGDGGTTVVPSLGAEGRFELPIAGPLAVSLTGGARVPLRRVTVTYQLSPSVSGDPDGSSETLHQAAPVSFWLGAGLVFQIF